MKVVTIIVGALVLLLMPVTAQAREESPTPKCMQHLKWNRWAYHKAHVNVTEAIREKTPAQVKWTQPKTQLKCRGYVWQAKKLRQAEEKHWSTLRYTREGIRWAIREVFGAEGDAVVRNAYQVVACESKYHRNAWNGRDAGYWQIELSAHPDVSWAEATDPLLSTEWSYRASNRGTDFSPTWTCATSHGIA